MIASDTDSFPKATVISSATATETNEVVVEAVARYG